MANKYTSDGDYIIDAAGKHWSVELWHAMPLPHGIDAIPSLRDPVICGFEEPHRKSAAAFNDPQSTHWLARRPLPPVPIPRPKTQEELDIEAFASWHLGAMDDAEGTLKAAFLAGCAHARKEGE